MSGPPEVRYARSRDGIDIAYQVHGRGPVDVVFVPGFVSHLDLMWEMPPFEAMRDALVRCGRLTTFDKRGTGLSDRTLGFGSLEERMHDITAVLDAAGVERAHLFGISEGGPLALLFAASAPERVASVAVYGTFARLQAAPGYPMGLDRDIIEPFLAAVGDGWGTGRALRFFVQHMPRTDEMRQLLARYERSACTRQMATEILRLNTEIDVRDVLPTVRAPALVLQTTGDPLVPQDMARYLADHLPDARLVEGPGEFHVSWRAEEMWFLDELVSFFAGNRATGRSDRRALATVLFTDIVGSTAQAVAVGDAAWRMVLDRHDRVCAETVTRFGGAVVKATGDGLLATFDSPSAGVGCARELRARLTDVGVQIRAGVHTGEVELRDGDVGGIGVHIGARIAALAGADEIWVSRTVRDLTTGSDLVLESRGRHSLKGVPEEWDLHAVV